MIRTSTSHILDPSGSLLMRTLQSHSTHHDSDASGQSERTIYSLWLSDVKDEAPYEARGPSSRRTTVQTVHTHTHTLARTADEPKGTRRPSRAKKERREGGVTHCARRWSGRPSSCLQTSPRRLKTRKTFKFSRRRKVTIHSRLLITTGPGFDSRLHRRPSVLKIARFTSGFNPGRGGFTPTVRKKHACKANGSLEMKVSSH